MTRTPHALAVLSCLTSLVGCVAPSGSAPPVLPGEAEPECDLGPEAHYLVDYVRMPTSAEYPIDFNEPADGTADTENYPYIDLRSLGDALPTAIAEAFATHHVLWVITTQHCEDTGFARMLIRRGKNFDQANNSLVVDGNGIWAIGETGAGIYHVEEGVGVAPIALAADVDVAMSDTEWFDAYRVTMDASTVFDGTTPRLNGFLALTTPTPPTTNALAAALSRTLNYTLTNDPGCTAETSCMYSSMHVFLNVFDLDLDNRISAVEILESGNLPFLNVIPYLDLMAKYGGREVYWPDHDDVVDSMGSSYQFTARAVSVYAP